MFNIVQHTAVNTTEKITRKRGAYRRDDCVFLGAWVPKQIISALDSLVQAKDSDRSKLVRSALIDLILSQPQRNA